MEFRGNFRSFFLVKKSLIKIQKLFQCSISHFSQTKQTTRDAHFGGLIFQVKRKKRIRKDVKRVRKMFAFIEKKYKKLSNLYFISLIVLR